MDKRFSRAGLHGLLESPTAYSRFYDKAQKHSWREGHKPLKIFNLKG